MENSNLYGLEFLTDKIKTEDSNVNTNLFNDTHQDSDIQSIISSVESEASQRLLNSDKSDDGSKNYSENESIDPEREQANMMEKRSILSKLRRYEEKSGVKIGRPLSINTPLSELKFELDIINKEVKMNSTINQMKTATVVGVYFLEMLNSKFDPLDLYLDGWSAHFQEEIDTNDDLFEELYDKWFDSMAYFPPEVRFVLMVGSSGFMYNMRQRIFKNKKIQNFFNKEEEITGPSGSVAEEILNDKSINITFK